MKSIGRNKCGGFSLPEVMIAMLITGILTASAFQFYVKMHLQSETQYDISEMQQLCRASIQEITRTLRMSGFKLVNHPAYELRGDTLAIYYSMSQPVDTILYYLEEFSNAEYTKACGPSSSIQIWKLMKKVNNNPAMVYADYITGFTSVQVDSSNVIVTIKSITPRSDEFYSSNSGFRTDSLSQLVHIRNAT